MASLQSLLDAKDKQLQDQMKRGDQNASDIGTANSCFPFFYLPGCNSSFPFKVKPEKKTSSNGPLARIFTSVTKEPNCHFASLRLFA